jgi:hypothetical protein
MAKSETGMSQNEIFGRKQPGNLLIMREFFYFIIGIVFAL